jgi:hypothetical protein
MIELREKHGWAVLGHRYAIEFADLGEGMAGDYDPTDKHDVRLLRIDLWEKIDGAWQELDDGSYCTLVPVNTSDDRRQEILTAMLAHVHDQAELTSVRRAAERLSWADGRYRGGEP